MDLASIKTALSVILGEFRLAHHPDGMACEKCDRMDTFLRMLIMALEAGIQQQAKGQ